MMSRLYRMRMLFILFAISGTIVASSIVSECRVLDDYEYITCPLVPSTRSRGAHSHPRIPYSRDPRYTEYSTNWAGYVAETSLTSPLKNSVTKVVGSWTVPNVTVVSGAGDTYCAVWVGLDGSKSPSVEQLGTSHDVVGGQVQHSAWVEMYPQPSQDLTGFPVEVGDSITASVTYVSCSSVLPPGNSLFILQMVNNTKKVFTMVPFIIADPERLCAEWIVEAPYMNGILPLSNFGTAHLFDCTAEINNVVGAINNHAWANDLMHMITPQGTLKAVTSPLSADGKSFSVAWKHV